MDATGGDSKKLRQKPQAKVERKVERWERIIFGSYAALGVVLLILIILSFLNPLPWKIAGVGSFLLLAAGFTSWAKTKHAEATRFWIVLEMWELLVDSTCSTSRSEQVQEATQVLKIMYPVREGGHPKTSVTE